MIAFAIAARRSPCSTLFSTHYAKDGMQLVEVKTLDSSAGYAPSDATRAFWERRGFVQIDKIDWPHVPPTWTTRRGFAPSLFETLAFSTRPTLNISPVDKTMRLVFGPPPVVDYLRLRAESGLTHNQ